jgi:hypothetical protein
MRGSRPATACILLGAACQLLPAGVVCIAALLVYRSTLLPTVSAWGDSAKFQYIAQVWGIPHPTGYPLYILLTRLFAMLPWGDIAYRVNLLSAVCAALAAAGLYLLAVRVIAIQPAGQRSLHPWSAAAAALSAAFSPLIWSQAVVAEVYALNAVFVVAALALVMRFLQTRRAGWLYAFLLAYGLSFSHHASMILLLPAVLFWLLAALRNMVSRALPVALAGVALGALPYAYILVRAAQGAPDSEFPPLAGRPLLIAFLDYLGGGQFRGAFFGVFGDGPAALWARAQQLGEVWWRQFGWWGIGLGMAGWAWLWRRDRVATAGLTLALLGEAIFALGYRIIDPQVYLIPAILIWAVFIAAGLGWLAPRPGVGPHPLTPSPQSGEGESPPLRYAERGPGGALRSRAWPAGRRLAFFVLCAALVALPLLHNWPAADRSGDYRARRWAEGFLHDVQPQALLVLPQPYFYSQQQVLRYLQVAEGVRPDVGFIQPAEIDAWVGRRPVYLAVYMPDVAVRYRVTAVDSSDLRLADYLAGLPEGTIVVAAVKDEASRELSAEAAAAWQLVGARADLRGCFRCAHALIGVRGAAPGTALESSGPGRHTVEVGAGELIGATGVRAPVTLRAESAGLDAGDVGDIWLGAWPVSLQQRGYNVVAVAAESGRLLSAVSVDTFDSDRVDNVRKYLVTARQ